MDYSAYSLPTADVQYDYQDDGLGGDWQDDGAGVSSYGAAQDSTAAEDPLDFMDAFVQPEQPPDPSPAEAAATPSEQQTSAQPSATAADADLDDELAAALEEEMFKPAAEDNDAQQADDMVSDVETDDALGEPDDASGSRGEYTTEDPAQAELQKQNAWYKECYDAMTEAQRNRLEAFNRSNLQRKSMKRVVQELTGISNPNDKLLVALCSVSKIFVGELVTKARQLAACQGHAGPLLPAHIRAAYQLLSEDGKVPHKVPSKPLRLR